MVPKVIWWSPMTKICIFCGSKKAIWGGSKMAKFAPIAPKRHLGVSHDQNLYIPRVKNAHFVGQKCLNLKEKKCLHRLKICSCVQD